MDHPKDQPLCLVDWTSRDCTTIFPRKNSPTKRTNKPFRFEKTSPALGMEPNPIASEGLVFFLKKNPPWETVVDSTQILDQNVEVARFIPLHPGRLTWNIIIGVWKIIFLSEWVICRFHVNLPGCIDKVFYIPGGCFGFLPSTVS